MGFSLFYPTLAIALHSCQTPSLSSSLVTGETGFLRGYGIVEEIWAETGFLESGGYERAMIQNDSKGTPYNLNFSSLLNRVNPSTSACAMSKRSNGSL